MPTITQLTPQRRKENRRNVHLDGAFAFGCNLNVVAKFMLREGLVLTEAEVEKIKHGEVRQECYDHAMRFVQRRMHSRSELKTKLGRQEYDAATIESVLDSLQAGGYVDDAKFAASNVESSAKNRHHGRRRAAIELLKKGVTGEDARKALDNVYDTHDSLAAARDLAQKRYRSLAKLPPEVARRRLAGMLMRRGYAYDVVRPAIDEVVGNHDDSPMDS